MPAEDVALADRYMEAVTHNLPKGPPFRAQLRNHKGKVVIDFKGAPVTLVAQLVQALQAQLSPQPEVTQARKVPPSN